MGSASAAWTWVVMGLATAFCSQIAPARSSPIAQIPGPPAQPTHAVTPLGECHVIDVVWSDDSSRAYVSMQVTAMDVWPLVVRFWPELVASASGGLLLILLLSMGWRRWRRRRVVAIGEPHCARCGYQLTGREGAAMCPECGRALSSGQIILGRRLRRWPVVLTMLLLAGLAGGYLVGRTRLPRAGSASSWFSWPSARAYLWATKRQYWSLIGVPTHRIRIAEVDPLQGRIVRTIFDQPATRRHGGKWYPRISRAFDDDHLLLRAPADVAEISRATGSITRQWKLPAELVDSGFGLCDVAAHPSRPLLYGYVGWKTVGAWDCDRGEWNALEVYPVQSQFLMHSLYPNPDADTVWLRRVLDRRSPESGFDLIDLATLEPVFSNREPKHDLSQIAATNGSEVLFTQTEFAGTVSQQVSEQTIWRWAPGMDGAQLLLSVPLRRVTTIAVGQQTGRFFFSGRPVVSGIALPVVATFDRASGMYLQPLESPPRGDVGMSLSPDERWVITTIPGETRDACIFIFDLHAIHGTQPAR